MATIEIRGGLRRMDFTVTDKGNDSGERHVVVEFAQSAELANGQIVRINLGIRDGLLRTLEGLPASVKPAKSGKPLEYLYRLEGHVG
jgi:hypothetical protein